MYGYCRPQIWVLYASIWKEWLRRKAHCPRTSWTTKTSIKLLEIAWNFGLVDCFLLVTHQRGFQTTLKKPIGNQLPRRITTRTNRTIKIKSNQINLFKLGNVSSFCLISRAKGTYISKSNGRAFRIELEFRSVGLNQSVAFNQSVRSNREKNRTYKIPLVLFGFSMV